MAGRVLTRMGVALLVMSLLARPWIRTGSALWADNLAVVASVAVILTGVIGARVAGKDDHSGEPGPH